MQTTLTRDERIHSHAMQLSMQGPDEFGFGYYKYLARRHVDENLVKETFEQVNLLNRIDSIRTRPLVASATIYTPDGLRINEATGDLLKSDIVRLAKSSKTNQACFIICDFTSVHGQHVAPRERKFDSEELQNAIAVMAGDIISGTTSVLSGEVTTDDEIIYNLMHN